ncbi:MAG: hypothetical protein AB8C84_10310 [Oligoflexales bacterium]
MPHASRKYWFYDTCLVVILGFSALFHHAHAYAHSYPVQKSSSGLSQSELQKLIFLKKTISSALQNERFFTYQHHKHLRSIYKDMYQVTEAIHLDHKTDEAHYTFIKLMTLLQQNFESFYNGKLGLHQLQILLEEKMLFNIENKNFLEKIKNHIKKIYFISINRNNISYKDLFFAKIITQNKKDPIVSHLINSYQYWKEESHLQRTSAKLLNLKDHSPYHIHESHIQKIEKMITSSMPKLTYKSQKIFLRKARSATYNDLHLLNLFSKIQHLDFAELLRGAHFILDDNAQLYLDLQKNHIIETHIRTSSHYPQEKTPQFGLSKPSPLFHEILFGKISNKEAQKEATWFQTEKYGFGKLKEVNLGVLQFYYPSNRYLESWSHLKSFSYHIKSNLRQVGPYGFSSHSEKINSAIFLK